MRAKRSRFGIFLRACRKRRFGSERKAVAQAAGLMPNQLAQFEIGRTKPSLYQLARLCQVLQIDLVKALRVQLRESTPHELWGSTKRAFMSLLAASPELARLESPEHVLKQTARLVSFANATLTKDNWIAETWLHLVAGGDSQSSAQWLSAAAKLMQEQQNVSALGFYVKKGKVSHQAVAQLQLLLRLTLAGLMLPSPYKPRNKRPSRKAVPQLGQLVPVKYYKDLSDPDLGLQKLLEQHTPVAVVLIRALVEYAEAFGQDICRLAQSALIDLDLERLQAERAKASVAGRLTSLYQQKMLWLVLRNDPGQSLRIGIAPKGTEAFAWYWLGQFLTLPHWRERLAKCSDLKCANLLIKRSPRHKWCSQHQR